MSSIFQATQNGDLSEIKRIIASVDEKDVVNFIDTPQLISGLVPFHIAAKHGFLDICEYFLQLGASVDITDTNDRTPLHYAAKGKFLDICKLLIDEDAYLDSKVPFSCSYDVYIFSFKEFKIFFSNFVLLYIIYIYI